MHRSRFELAGTTNDDEYWYVPGELLVHADDSDAAVAALAAKGYAPSSRRPGGAVVFTAAGPDATDAVELVEAPIRRADGSALRISPHYLFTVCQRIPKSADHARATSEVLPPLHGAVSDFVVGVVDTGVVHRDDEHHGEAHPWIASRLVASDGQDDELPKPGGLLEPASGHGTFVAGMILKEAPAARIRMVAGLPGGGESEETVAAAIQGLADAGVTLINLSFSGDTARGGDDPPVALGAVLSCLPDDVVVVAAAGNFGDSRKVWPAAFERVIAVGAVDDQPADFLHRAPFSNYGPWVDVYAGGAFVLGPYCWHREVEEQGGCLLDYCWHGETVRDPQHYRGWARWSGTSFAAATVSGAIARVAIDEGVTAAEAARRVLDRASTVTVAGAPGGAAEIKPYVRSLAASK